MDTLNLPQEFLNYQIQYQAQNALEVGKKSGDRIAIVTHTSTVSATGTTFATGTDILTTGISFTASGSQSYIVRLLASDWTNSSATNNHLRLNLDGVDGGFMAVASLAATGFAGPIHASAYITPPAGSHDVNVRMDVGAGTGQIFAGSGGAGNRVPIVVTLEVA